MFRLLIVLAMMIPGFAYGYECSKNVDELSVSYGVPIHCKTESFSFISSSIKGKRASQQMIDDIYPALSRFFSLYNKKFLSSNIEEIVLLRDLTFTGASVGGLSDGNVIYICLDDYENDLVQGSSIYFNALNHEFSSNILKKMKFTKKIVWRTISDVYFETREYLLKCLRDTRFSRTVNSKLLENGFLANYALTNMENDFNVYAEKLFSKDIDLISAKEKYSNVKKKLELLKEVYREAGFKGNFPDETWQTTTTILLYHHSPIGGHNKRRNLKNVLSL